MFEEKPVKIVLIAFYCLFLGLFALYLVTGAVFSNNRILSGDPWVWLLPLGLTLILTIFLVAVGIGVVYFNQLCWKILYFSLVISISFFISLFFIVLVLMFLDFKFHTHFFHATLDTSNIFFSYLCFVLWEVFALYSLTTSEVMSHFEEMSGLIEPF